MLLWVKPSPRRRDQLSGVMGSNKCDSGVRDACAAAVLLAVIVHPGCDRCGVHAGQWSVVGISIADTGEEPEDPLLIEKTQKSTARRRVCSPSLAALAGQANKQVRFCYRFGGSGRQD